MRTWYCVKALTIVTSSSKSNMAATMQPYGGDYFYLLSSCGFIYELSSDTFLFCKCMIMKNDQIRKRCPITILECWNNPGYIKVFCCLRRLGLSRLLFIGKVVPTWPISFICLFVLKYTLAVIWEKSVENWQS